MKKDIESRADIEALVNTFYDKVKQDATIGYFFSEVVQVQWEKHLPIMYTFWENVLFHTGGYEGNPMRQHMAIHAKSAMTHAHFQQWLALFTQTVDELFSGDNAEQIKQRAGSIAMVMELKIIT